MSLLNHFLLCFLFLSILKDSNSSKLEYDDQTIEWSGYTWRIKEGYRDPGPNYFTNETISVSDDDVLTLVSKPLTDGNWSTSEIYTKVSLGHGTYRWIIESEVANFSAPVCLGLFTWEDNASEVYNREIDIEISKFGDTAETTNAQFTIQPYTTSGNIDRFNIEPSSGSSQAEFTWSPCGVTFRFIKKGESDQYINHTDTRYHMDHGAENVHMNLWLYAGQPPFPANPVVVNISSFTFIPLDESDPEYIVPCESTTTTP